MQFSCPAAGCEWWAIEVVVLLAGLLPNPHLSMSVMGITINLHAFAFLAAQGLGGAASTCVAQDLGAGQPQQAIRKTKVSAALGSNWCIMRMVPFTVVQLCSRFQRCCHMRSLR